LGRDWGGAFLLRPLIDRRSFDLLTIHLGAVAMESGHQAPGDILQVIPRRSPSGGPPPDGGGTGSLRISLPPARRKRLARIVFAAVGACGLILVAAGIVHVLRPGQDTAAFAATATAAAPSTPVAPPTPQPASAPPVATAAAPAPDVPQTGTLRLQRPASPGKVWLDGQKITVASATVACGQHQLKVGRGKAHAIDVPCGGDLKISK
jgi:hypothetical protein